MNILQERNWLTEERLKPLRSTFTNLILNILDTKHGERDDKGLKNYLVKISGSRKVNGAVQCTLHLIQRNVSIIKAMNSRKKKGGFVIQCIICVIPSNC